jgi:hypothetical protein
MSFFFRNREQEGKTGPVWEAGTSVMGQVIRKEYRRVNMIEILYVHVCKWKNETC